MKEKNVARNTLHEKRYIIAMFILFCAMILLCIFKAKNNMDSQPEEDFYEKTVPLYGGVLSDFIGSATNNYVQDGDSHGQIVGDGELSHDMHSWVGEYIYVETFPHNSGELSYVIGITITIYEQDGDYYAQINGDGWFLETRSLAKVTGDEDSIDIIFLGNAVDDPLYERNIQRYEYGEELVHFERLESGEINTEWKSLRDQHPFSFWVDAEEGISGIYFAKVDRHEDDIDEQAAIEMVCEKVRTMDFAANQPQMELTPEENRMYLEGYLKMLKGEIPVVDSSGEEYEYKHLWNTKRIRYEKLLLNKNLREMPYLYYYGDMDGDGMPEFVTKHEWMGVYKYEPNEDKVKRLYNDVSYKEDEYHFIKLVGAGQFWYHNEQDETIVRDQLMTFDEEGMHTVLNLRQRMEEDSFYYEVAKSNGGFVDIGKENWDELITPFFEMVENNELPRMTLEEVFGELLE